MRLFYTILFTAFFLGSLAQAKQVVLTDTQGRELVCKLLNKNESSVLVSNNGRKFIVSLGKLSPESVEIVNTFEFIIADLLKELKADDAYKGELRVGDINNVGYFTLNVVSMRPMTSRESRHQQEKAASEFRNFLLKYGELRKELIKEPYNMSMYEFIEASCDIKYADTVGRIISSCFGLLDYEGYEEKGRNMGEFTQSVYRINKITDKIPDHNLSKQLSNFISEIYSVKGDQDRRLRNRSMNNYKVSRQFSDSAKRLLSAINSIDEMYSL